MARKTSSPDVAEANTSATQATAEETSPVVEKVASDNTASEDMHADAEDTASDNPTSAAENRKAACLVICAYSGTEQLLAEIWKQNCDVPFEVFSVAPDTDIREAIEACIADADIADEFVIVPANAFPCAPVSFAELSVPVVYVDNNQQLHYNFRLPMHFIKDKLVEHLAASDATGENFVKEYVEQYCTRPMQVGFSFGNYVTPVLRSTPCESVVLEGLLRRKFIVATPDGFSAIEPLIRTTLLKR